MNRLFDALCSGRVLLMDGAMGTELQRLGLRDDECSALWNVTHPEQVAAVHAAYLEAGAEVLLTNTFAVNRAALARQGREGRLVEVWNAGVNLAQTAGDRNTIVLCDIGPGGERDLYFPDRPDKGGVLYPGGDGDLFETWSCADEPQPRLPHPKWWHRAGTISSLVSFTFRHHADGTVQTHDGACPASCALHAIQRGSGALGANCGAGIDMDDMREIVREYRFMAKTMPLFVRPNAGTPRRTATGWKYPRSPEEMADKLWPLLEAGVTMVGGCCGTTPAHIAAFRRVVDEWNARRG